MKPLHFTYFFLLLLITACQSGKDNYSDISGHIKSTLIAVSKEENYFYPVWLPDNMISFLSLPAGENYFSFPQPNQPTLQLYDLKETSWGEIPFKPDINCDRTKGYFFQRLPDGKIGFVYGCLRFDSGIEVRTIRELDIATGISKILIEPSSDIRRMGPFAFSNNMSEIIEEDMSNHILSNKLFYRKGENSSQIASNFIRAMNPAWSTHTRQIAFWGTEDYPGKKPRDFQTSSDISFLATYPWDLYIASPEGENLKILLTSIQGKLDAKWSPKENVIAFSGTFENRPGIWLINPETAQLTRIWSTMGDADFFDWSPDGEKIVVVNSSMDKNFKVLKQEIRIIYLYNE